jgi:hypothetical protein
MKRVAALVSRSFGDHAQFNTEVGTRDPIPNSPGTSKGRSITAIGGVFCVWHPKREISGDSLGSVI